MEKKNLEIRKMTWSELVDELALEGKTWRDVKITKFDEKYDRS